MQGTVKVSKPAADAGRLSMNETLLMQTDAVLVTQALQAVWLSVMCICAQPISCVFVTTWTVACQAPLSLEFSRQESWDGWMDSLFQRMELTSLVSSALADRFFITSATWEVHFKEKYAPKRVYKTDFKGELNMNSTDEKEDLSKEENRKD